MRALRRTPTLTLTLTPTLAPNLTLTPILSLTPTLALTLALAPTLALTLTRCELSNMQKVLYRQIQEQGLCTVGENNQLKVSGLNNVEMQLRKVRGDIGEI